MQPVLTPCPYELKGKVALGSAMRNEGVFVLEWVAYHLGIGFDKVFVYTNNCQDGTDAILSRLAQMLPGQVIHHDHDVIPGQSVQAQQFARLRQLPEIEDVEFLAIVDADEYLTVTTGEGRIQDLLSIVGHADCIGMLWKNFGDSGMKWWTHGRVLTRQVRCENKPYYPMHKSIFRPEKFDRIYPHFPTLYLATPDQPEPLVVNTRGTPMRFQGGEGQRYILSSPSDVTWDNACIHHHAIKTPDILAMKTRRGKGHAAVNIFSKYRLGGRFMSRINRNGRKDKSAIKYDHRTLAYLDAFMADPQLAQLQKQAEDWLDHMRDTYLTPENVHLWAQENSIYRQNPELIRPRAEELG